MTTQTTDLERLYEENVRLHSVQKQLVRYLTDYVYTGIYTGRPTDAELRMNARNLLKELEND